jgi:histidine triad (HIT) family protein
MSMPDECLFCRIVRGAVPATVVGETNDCLAFRDVNPQAPVHVIVVPKTHIASLNDATDVGILGRLVALATKIASDEGLAESGYRVVVNTNRDGGQTVFHLHLHVLGGRHMAWPPG